MFKRFELISKVKSECLILISMWWMWWMWWMTCSLQPAVEGHPRGGGRRQCRSVPHDPLVHQHLPHALLQPLVPRKGNLRTVKRTFELTLNQVTKCKKANKWNVKFQMCRCLTKVLLPTSGSMDYSLSLRPDYHQAVLDIIAYYGWKNIVYIYDSHDGNHDHHHLTYHTDKPLDKLNKQTLVARLVNQAECVNVNRQESFVKALDKGRKTYCWLRPNDHRC